MISFSATIKKYANQGEKTGWTIIEISAAIANAINPSVKKSYRVKGMINGVVINGIAILPMGEGNFILAINKDLKKRTKVVIGQLVELQLKVDKKGYQLNSDFIECLNDEPLALTYFNTLTNGHKNYFSKWIEQAKTEETKAKRIANSVNALAKKWGYPEMIRNNKKQA